MEHLFHEHHSIPETDQHCQASQHIHKITSLSLCKAKEGIKDLFSLPCIPRIPKLVSLGFPGNLASFTQFWRGNSLRLLVKETHQGKPNWALPIAAGQQDYFCHFISVKALNLLPTSTQHKHREATEVQGCILEDIFQCSGVGWNWLVLSHGHEETQKFIGLRTVCRNNWTQPKTVQRTSDLIFSEQTWTLCII